MKRAYLWLICCLPLTSAAAIAVLWWLAVQFPDADVAQQDQPLSKTSWQQPR